MNAFTQIDELVMPLPLEPRGYTIAPSKQSPRLLELTFARETVEAFVQAVAQWPAARAVESAPRQPPGRGASWTVVYS